MPSAIKTSEDNYNFPFPPYNIQLKLMNVAYDVYEQSKFALLESPTGTGKSLSLICSSLTWLLDHQKRRRKILDDKKEGLTKLIEEMKREEESSGDWLTVQTKRQDIDRELINLSKDLDKLVRIEAKDEARRNAKIHNQELDINPLFLDTSVNLEPLIDDIEEDIEKRIKEIEVDEVQPKIYYASRTHSQLNQFVNEVKKTNFSNINNARPVKVVPIASRHLLCVNPNVVSLKEPSAINEKCTELQREKSADKRCPYARLKQINKLKEEVLSSVQDIEDIVETGKKLGSCPYYANRMAVAEAELVVLPYNNLLHNETRKASSLNLTDSVIILDEAHNILETICSIHSSPISGLQLIKAHMILSSYCFKFHKRMNPKNVIIIKMIVSCLTAIIKFLDNPSHHMEQHDGSILDKSEDKPLNPTHEELMVDVHKFIGAANMQSYNIFMFMEYFNRSQLPRKLIGIDHSLDLSLDLADLNFEDKNFDKSSTSLSFLKKENLNILDDLTKPTSYPMYSVIEFLKSLTSRIEDGKIFVDHIKNNISMSMIKFVLLNPAGQFEEMTKQARSLVLAGGTMQPFSEFEDLLFKHVDINSDRLVTFSCGHVIKPDQIYFATLSQGTTNKPLEMSYKNRTNMETIDEYGRTIFNLSMVAPGGMVCFFPSYEYERTCWNRWKSTGMIDKIESKTKKVFREPREANQLNRILEEYASSISQKSGKGALLMCVVGGKMSEGINFNDDLGRCVVMIGQPYANIRSKELKQKMAYYDRTCTLDNRSTNRSPGQQYYENLCIKGINQSIGRAVRHRNDYAAILLLDSRYLTNQSIRSGLPGWMSPSLVDHVKFGILFSELKGFFDKIKLEIM